MTKEWTWRWFNLILTLFVGLGVYTIRIDRKKDIMEALQEYDKIVQERYLTRRDFDSYRAAHTEWSVEVIKRLELDIASLKVRSEANAKLLFDIHSKLLSKQLGAITP